MSASNAVLDVVTPDTLTDTMLTSESTIMPPIATSTRPPVWWEQPQRQLALARRLWPEANLPTPPKRFDRLTKSEVLLLHVPRPIDQLWNCVAAPDGYSTRLLGVGSAVTSDMLRLAPNVPERTEAVWVAFDPEHGIGQRPCSFWGNPDLAGLEVLSALIQFPRWSQSWHGRTYKPSMSGLQMNSMGSWRNVPYVVRWDAVRRLMLTGFCGDGYMPHWVSPTARNC